MRDLRIAMNASICMLPDKALFGEAKVLIQPQAEAGAVKGIPGTTALGLAFHQVLTDSI
jgi:hypothetical protein